MLDPLGGNSLQYLLVWFFIASWTFIDPGFYQRCSAAKNPDTAKKGILFSIQSLISGNPGSEMIGVPASDIIPMSISSIRYESIFLETSFSLCS